MAGTTVDQYVVELIIDDTQLESTLDQLERTGVIDAKVAAGFKASTAEIKKQAEAIRSSATASAPLKKNLDNVNASVKTLGQTAVNEFVKKLVPAFTAAEKEMVDFLKQVRAGSTDLSKFSTEFKEGFLKSLDEGGVSLEQFAERIQALPQEVESLKQRYATLIKELQILRNANQQNTAEYAAAAQEAAALKSQIEEVSKSVADLANDTSLLSNLVGSLSAVVGGFTAFQGVVGLVGDESEDLQKVLLKVNSAMAVLQGLQAIQNSLTATGSITLLQNNIQRGIQNALIVVQNGLESKSIIIRGAAIVAQKALNAAMKANPIGLVVTALAGLITALTFYNRLANDAERETGELNSALEDSADGFEKSANNIRKVNTNLTNELRASGAAQSEILRNQNDLEDDIDQQRIIRAETLRKTYEKNIHADKEARQAALAQINKLEEDIYLARIDRFQREQELNKQLTKEALDAAQAVADARVIAAGEGSREQLNAQRAAIQARLAVELNAEGLLDEQRARLRAQAEKDDYELRVAYNRRILEQQVKDIETRIINVQEGTEEEYRLRLELLKRQGRAELENSKLSSAERKAIIAANFQEQLKLTREYNEAVVAEAIAAQQRINNAALDSLKTNDEDRLALQIDNIELAAAAEVNAAKGNASKIKEINAQRDADILAVRKQFIQDAVEYEIQLRNANDGALRRALQRTAANERVSFAGRIAAVKEFGQLEIDNVNLRGQALRKERKQGLITEKEYNLRYAELQDEKKKINEETELEITALHAEQVRQRIEIAFTSAQQLSNVFATLSDNRAQLEDNRIAKEREELDRLKEQGLISEREAIARAKRIDAEEKKIKQQQARREKNLAIFNAVIQTAQAVASALPNFVLAAIVGAFGAAQVAAIAARPIPAFGRGKKNDYEGLARVGETGSELIERDGKMYVAPKETIVYLGAKDKVYNPQETKAMLSGTHRVDPNILQPVSNDAGIDYNKLAEAIAVKMQGAIKTTNFEFHKDGFLEWVEGALDQKKYFTNRYSSKR